MAKKNNIIDIVNGISQAAANAYDGALDDKGEPQKIGLKREEGDLVLDTRVIDGFNVSISGNTLILKYQGEILLKDVYKGDFEGEIAQRLQDIVSYLKKEFKKITGNALTLTKIDKEKSAALINVRSAIEMELKQHGAAHPEILGTSAKKSLGLEKLRANIATLVEEGGLRYMQDL